MVNVGPWEVPRPKLEGSYYSLLTPHSSCIKSIYSWLKPIKIGINSYQNRYQYIYIYIIFTNNYLITQYRSVTIILPASASTLNNNKLLQIRDTIWLWWSYLLCLYIEILARFQYTTIPQVSTNKVRLTQSIHAFPYMFLFQV